MGEPNWKSYMTNVLREQSGVSMSIRNTAVEPLRLHNGLLYYYILPVTPPRSPASCPTTMESQYCVLGGTPGFCF